MAVQWLTMKARLLIGSVVGGVLITLLSGLLRNTPEMLVGAEHFGYPFPWLRRVVYPGAPLEVPPEYYVNLIVDVVIWAMIVGVILVVLMRRKK